MPHISERVQFIFRATTHVLGESFSRERLIQFTEAMRSKRLVIEYDIMPTAMSGYCIALQDADFICTRVGLDPILTDAACFHEIAHLLLGHIPHLSNGPTTPSYDTFIRSRNAYRTDILCRLGNHTSMHETDAEILATLFFHCIKKERNTAPSFVCDFFML